MSRHISHVSRLVTTFCVLIAAAGSSLAQNKPITGTTPADPSDQNDQMIIACMKQQDPALKKQDAIDLCKKKLKQGIAIDKPKQKHKPAESNETPPNNGR